MVKRRRRSRAKRASGLPKGAYRMPTGGYAIEFVGTPDARGRRLRVIAVYREQPDLHQIARALLRIEPNDEDPKI